MKIEQLFFKLIYWKTAEDVSYGDGLTNRAVIII